MSKYEELSSLGAKHFLALRNLREFCRLAAHELMRELLDYLECPPQKMTYYSVNPDYTLGKEGYQFAQGLPEMTLADDGFWYFAVALEFSGAGQYAYIRVMSFIGLKRTGSNILVRYKRDRDFEVNPDAEEGRMEFFNFFYLELKEDLEKPIDKPNKRLGFHETFPSSVN